jgi:acetylglutamate kinase
MIPKMESPLNAVKGGAAACHVIDGRLAHSVLLELLTMGGIGTMVLPDNYERSRYPEGTVFRKDDAQ